MQREEDRNMSRNLSKLDNTLQEYYGIRLEYFENNLTELIDWLETNHFEKSRELVEWIEWADLNGWLN
jgi:hypothetical protein